MRACHANMYFCWSEVFFFPPSPFFLKASLHKPEALLWLSWVHAATGQLGHLTLCHLNSILIAPWKWVFFYMLCKIALWICLPCSSGDKRGVMVSGVTSRKLVGVTGLCISQAEFPSWKGNGRVLFYIWQIEHRHLYCMCYHCCFCSLP